MIARVCYCGWVICLHIRVITHANMSAIDVDGIALFNANILSILEMTLSPPDAKLLSDLIQGQLLPTQLK